jgi:site-specific DNA-methyltransferase (adenine-specific)
MGSIISILSFSRIVNFKYGVMEYKDFKEKSQHENSTVYLMDCMDALRQTPDNYYSLALVDPPYGIDVANMNMGAGKGKRCSKLQNRKWKPKDWDNGIPNEEYFEQLFRVSKNQIVWGGNYFIDFLPPSQYFAIWDKGEGLYGRSFAECEYAWVRSGGTRIKKINPVQKERIHPTQKPVELYDWLLSNYAKEGDLILDTHLGSGSSRIAAYKGGFNFVGFEIDADYYRKACKRFEEQTCQIALW